MGRKKNWLVSAKLRVLAKHFERGAVPGKRRKRQAYRKRKNKAQKKYCWSHLEEQREWHRNHYHAKKKRSTDARSSLL